MKTETPLFQVVIPTVRGRERYLKDSILSVLEQHGCEAQVIVSNNGADPLIRECVKSFHHHDILYLETMQYLSMAEHWEFAIGYVTADFFCILGDDDALTPSCTKRVALALQQYPGEKCVVHRPAQYFWPDYLDDEYKNLYLVHGDCTGRVMQKTTGSVFQKVCEFREHYGKLPFLYHGFVSTQLVRDIQKKEGKIFGKIAPDVYSDLLLAVYMDTFLEIDAPLTIGGQGARSNGANVFKNTSEGKKFFENLPDFLVPRRPGVSIYLQLFEYIEEIRSRHKSDQVWDVCWWRFVGRTMVEAIRNESYRKTIITGTKDVLLQYCPYLKRMVMLALVWLVEVRIGCKIAEYIYKLKSTRNQKAWRSAKIDFSASSVIGVARALDERGRV